ncbi:SGNH/GDSL hydrolase family protein [Nocardioides sp. GY 10113]|uniref:SGNH/GDSL hydrolase family protein n=1 Tax=Nocardioides sp. GY 10113 TaxID=2569761 RepID=UPI0010A87D3E|nr:SGNH/GDSL hydrolase family protein [Nocardioides sp. GY 10113]TIC85862.1 SGNH/GDSL hydrolase family protein [Nocardioides sp. GY 10113]
MVPRRTAVMAGTALAGAGFVAGAAAGGARVLLTRQASIARRAIGKPLGERAPDADRVWKGSYGDPLDLLLLGDSIAAGLGAERPKDTLGGRLARGLAKELGRAVRLRTAAVVGAESSALAGQIDGLPHGYAPELAVIVVGGNDVTHRVPVPTSVRHLEEAIGLLRERGAHVVVGTCPDLGALRPVPQPLRTLGSRASRQLAAAQAATSVRSGAHAISLAHVVGPFFISNPEEMFSTDRFHPSATGYKRTAKALLPSLLTALGENDAVPFGHHPPAPGEGSAGAPS